MFKLLARLFESQLIEKHRTQIGVAVGKLRRQPLGFATMDDGLLELTLLPQQISEVEVCIGHIGIELHCPLQLGAGFIEFFLNLQRDPQRVVGGGKIGLQFQGCAGNWRSPRRACPSVVVR